MTVRITSDGVVQEWPGILDTGSDITIIPPHLVEALQLQIVSDDMDLYDASGNKTENAATYVADVFFEGLNFPDLLISCTPYPVVLIGRDALNDLLAVFDGPRRQFTVIRP